MALLLEIIVFCFCVRSIFSENHVKTNNDTKVLDYTNGLDVTGQTSINFKIKACSEVSIGLRLIFNEPSICTVLFGTYFSQIQSGPLTKANVSWLGLHCNCYVNLWISWSGMTIMAGTGTVIGDHIFINYTGVILDGINFIEVASTYEAYWMFNFSENSTNACTSTIPGSNNTSLNTTMTTSPTANMIQTNLSATEPQCVCSCDNITNTPLTNDELIQKIEQLRSELTVDTKKTSRYKRSLISTADDRSSSKCIGSFSVVFLVIVICVIVLMDFRYYAPKVFPQKK